jgi:hypothetical protein
VALSSWRHPLDACRGGGVSIAGLGVTVPHVSRFWTPSSTVLLSDCSFMAMAHGPQFSAVFDACDGQECRTRPLRMGRAGASGVYHLCRLGANQDMAATTGSLVPFGPARLSRGDGGGRKLGDAVP